jgi:hypothetical protein
MLLKVPIELTRFMVAPRHVKEEPVKRITLNAFVSIRIGI